MLSLYRLTVCVIEVKKNLTLVDKIEIYFVYRDRYDNTYDYVSSNI